MLLKGKTLEVYVHIKFGRDKCYIHLRDLLMGHLSGFLDTGIHLNIISVQHETDIGK